MDVEFSENQVIPEERKEELAQMVERAIENAEKAELDEEHRATVDQIREAEENRNHTKEALKSGLDHKDIPIHFGNEYMPGDNEVFVGSFDEIEYVERLAFEKLGYRGELLEEQCRESAKHHIDHAIPGIGKPGLELNYAAVFFLVEERGRDFLSFSSKIVQQGSTTLDVYLAMLKGPDKLSKLDEIELGGV